MHSDLALINVGAASPNVKIGDIDYNTTEIIKQIDLNNKGSFPVDVLVFPELCITGYSCGDLLTNNTLLKNTIQALGLIIQYVEDQMVIVGAPIFHRGKLYNCAIVMNQGQIIGIVPKTFIPNYKEFYEQRWFTSGKNVDFSEINGIPFGTDLIFEFDEAIIGVEICEDLWATIPPSSHQAIAGANII